MDSYWWPYALKHPFVNFLLQWKCVLLWRTNRFHPHHCGNISRKDNWTTFSQCFSPHLMTFPASYSYPLMMMCGCQLSCVGSKCITTVVCDVTEHQKMYHLSSSEYKLLYSTWRNLDKNLHFNIRSSISKKGIFFFFFLYAGGYSTGWPALYTPFVVFCLDCAVWPTSLCSLVSAGWRSAAPTMVTQSF